MTGNKVLLHNETLVGKAGQVQLPTGDLASVTHIGTSQLTGGDILQHVLCVPAFRFNLLSMSKVTKELNCFMGFFPTFCLPGFHV